MNDPDDILRFEGYELDVSVLYERMWDLGKPNDDGSRLYQPTDPDALKWIIQDLSGAPAVLGKTTREVNGLRQLVYAALETRGWADRINQRTFQLLRQVDAGGPEDTWDIAVGETLIRRHLHDRWGGGRYGGMEPSVKAHSVFLFTQPTVGETFGYTFDGWHADGTFHYTGDGQRGDQLPTAGGNKSLLDAPALGRHIRLFKSQGTSTTYLGEMQLADPPYYRADAPDADNEALRSVLVFRLRPLGQVAEDSDVIAPPELSGPEEIPIEAADIESYAQSRPDEPPIAVRREAALVKAYATWLSASGITAVRHKIPLPDGRRMFTDVFDPSRNELIEAKSSAARTHIRTGLGQILDYARFQDHEALALLLPARPSDDLIDLLHSHGVTVIWQSKTSFERSTLA